jgi:oligopeptide transport system permease protein
MTRLIVWRLVQLPVILAAIFTITLVMVWVIPGNPLDQPEGRRPSPEVQEAMLRQYNLDNPWTFAGSYLKSLLLHGDFGPSLSYPDQRVNNILASGLPVSVWIGVAGLAVALALGLAAGVAGALRPGSVLDMSSLALALVGVSLPTFITGTLLLIVFGGLLHWAPLGGWSGRPAQAILPALTLGAAPAAYIARLIRLGLGEVMASDYIRTARAKGLSPGRALFRHAFKVAFLPVLSFLGPAAAVTFTGSFVVEQVFGIPGLGQHFVKAVQDRDRFLVLGLVLVYSTILIVFNLIVDVAYACVDPRIEL